MYTKFYSLSARGLDADLVTIEVENYASHPGIVIVGLGDTAVQESRERVRAALKNAGYRFPRGRVVVNLAPADVKKAGPCFDLPIALGLIALSYGLKIENNDKYIYLGELSLDGKLSHVNGIIGLIDIAKKMGFKAVFVPNVNKDEASLIKGIDIIAVDKLKDALEHITGENVLSAYKNKLSDTDCTTRSFGVNFADIKGQEHAKRAIEIAAAGSHNIIMNGAPGTGKTMMAKALKGVLPEMDIDESLEITKIYSLSGLLSKDECLIRNRPFRIVHHTASGASLVGGGRIPKPGEISLAHRGVLFLDEIAEFPSQVLELMRQPMEDKTITISRTMGSLTYPAQFILCGAMNPCPCGYYQVQNTSKVCSCPSYLINRYQSKLSGPFMDRIDLFCQVNPIKYKELEKNNAGISSTDILAKVKVARNIQKLRFQDNNIYVNSEMSVKDIRKYCQIDAGTSDILEKAMDAINLSVRSCHRVLKIARTIADIDVRKKIDKEDVLEALQYRRYEL